MLRRGTAGFVLHFRNLRMNCISEGVADQPPGAQHAFLSTAVRVSTDLSKSFELVMLLRGFHNGATIMKMN